MREKGWGNNMKALSKAAGLGETAVRDLLTPGRRSNTNPTRRVLEGVGKQLDLTVAQMTSEPAPPAVVPVIGIVSAGEGWSPISADSNHTTEFRIDDDAFALEVRGDSMSPVYRDGDMIIAARRAIARSDNLVGLDCVVELIDGRRFVKILAKGSIKGKMTLRSYNVGHKDVEDVTLAWAAPIIWVKRGGR